MPHLRITRRLMPFLFVLYIFNYINRVNVGYAALQIPTNNIRVWTAEPESLNGGNPYHGVGVSRFNPPDNIAFMFGLGGQTEK